MATGELLNRMFHKFKAGSDIPIGSFVAVGTDGVGHARISPLTFLEKAGLLIFLMVMAVMVAHPDAEVFAAFWVSIILFLFGGKSDA